MRADGRDRVEVVATEFRRTSLAWADPNVLHDHVMREDVDAAANERDARRGCRLSCDGQEGLADFHGLAAQVDDTANFEHDDAWPGCCERVEYRPGPTRI